MSAPALPASPRPVGICASAVSDTVSNSLRVIKTVKQTGTDGSLGYGDVVKNIIAKDGLKGLFGRGLSTRLITNMLQSMVFSVGWKASEAGERPPPIPAAPASASAARAGRPVTHRCASLAPFPLPQAIEEELNKRAAAKPAAAAPAKGAAAKGAAAKGKGGKTASLSLALPAGLGGSALPAKELVTA